MFRAKREISLVMIKSNWPSAASSIMRLKFSRFFVEIPESLQLGAAVKAPSELTVGGIALDHDAKRVTLDGEEIALTPKEYDILYYLMQHPGKVFTPAELYRAVWNEAPVAIDNTVAVHIRHLREKLEINPSEPRYLKVVWGKGYKLEGDRT